MKHIVEILSDKEYDIEQHNIPIIANKIKSLMEEIVLREKRRKFTSTEDDETILRNLVHNAFRDAMIRRIRTVCGMKSGQKKD